MYKTLTQFSWSSYCYVAQGEQYTIHNNCHNFLSFLKQWGQSAIYKASAKGHIETVKVLLQAKADTEIQQPVTAFFGWICYWIVINFLLQHEVIVVAPYLLIQLCGVLCNNTYVLLHLQ